MILPKHQEKKYRVDSFTPILARLSELNSKKLGESSSTHYYAPQPTNDVVKIVEHADRCEVHVLEEDNGKFTLTQKIPLTGLKGGLKWLRRNEYHKVGVVRMRHTDYEYGDGVIGLYAINDFLHSVILDLPAGEHDAVAKELGVEGADVIKMPYNKYLEQMGRLELVDIAQLG